MQDLFFSTGQAARQLGIALSTVRVLCENRLIAAETTPGGHLRVYASEVERLKRDGLPPIPRPLPTESAAPTGNSRTDNHDHTESSSKPSDEVVSAADQVAITKSLLERRRIEREIEETEDWFRNRQRQQAAAEAVERQKIEARRDAQKRLLWVQQWTKYALNSVPSDARREVEMEVHAAVGAALSELHPNQADAIIQRVVDAAVHRALRPWTRNQDIERALRTVMNRLPWGLRDGSEYAPLKQRAWNAAAEALGRIREQAIYHEMETAALHAVQPIIRKYEHDRECQRMVRRVFIYGATREEQEGAQEAVRTALAGLPIGAATKVLEGAHDGAVASYKAAVAARKEKERLESERQARRNAAEWKADLHLDHIARYLENEYEFDAYSEMRREASRLRPLVRKALVEILLENPKMHDAEIRDSIEAVIEDNIVS